MTGPAEPTPGPFLGLTFSHLPMAEAIAALQHASQGDAWQYVVTPNAAHLARLSRPDAALWRIYANASFCFLDSRVISVLTRLVGLRPPPLVPGSDLVALLFQRHLTPTTSICIVGGDRQAIARISARHSVGKLSHLNPSFGFWRDEEEVARTVAFIVACRADYTFLAVGSPQQEILAARVAAAGGARGIGICAGASLDFIAGTRRRAPRFLQCLALEWAYRLATEPRRLASRYLVESPRALLLVLRHALGGHPGS